MDDSFRMRGVECVGNLDGERQQNLQIHRPPADAMLQRRAFQAFHGDEANAVAFADFINRANIGMVERGRRLCLTLKAVERLSIVGNLLGQKFQCDKATQGKISSPIDNTPPTAPKLLDDAVVRYGLADHWRRMLRR